MYETNLVFIRMKIEHNVIDSADSGCFTIHFCIQAFQTKFSRSKNKQKAYLKKKKKKLSVIDIQLQLK